MSRSTYVNYKGNGFWVRRYEVGVFLEYLINFAEEWIEQKKDNKETTWIEECIELWEFNIYNSEFGVHLDEGWSDKELAIVISLIKKTYPHLKKGFSKEIGKWNVESVIKSSDRILSLLCGTFSDSSDDL